MKLSPEMQEILDHPEVDQVFLGVATKGGQIEFAFAMNVSNVALLLALAQAGMVEQSKALKK